MQDHELIELVMNRAVIAYETKWQYMMKIQRIRIALAYVLCQFLERGLVADMFKIKEESITTRYLTEAHHLMRIDPNFKAKVSFIKNGVIQSNLKAA